MSRLDEIQAQLDAATPGPWERNDYVDIDADGSYDLAHVTAPDPHEPDTAVQGVALAILRPDAEFIAAAPENTRYLLDLARKQQAQLDALRATMVENARHLRIALEAKA